MKLKQLKMLLLLTALGSSPAFAAIGKMDGEAASAGGRIVCETRSIKEDRSPASSYEQNLERDVPANSKAAL